MNRFVWVGAILILVIGGMVIVQQVPLGRQVRDVSDSSSATEVIEYEIEGRMYRLYTARTAAEWRQGLMNHRSLDGVDGMIFYFPDEEIRNFWNKNTFMDLDVYWIRGDKVVGVSELPSIEKSGDIVSVSSPEEVDVVVEIVKTTP